jgi:hypothetical protein
VQSTRRTQQYKALQKIRTRNLDEKLGPKKVIKYLSNEGLNIVGEGEREARGEYHQFDLLGE